jgi:hypothetical protein
VGQKNATLSVCCNNSSKYRQIFMNFGKQYPGEIWQQVVRNLTPSPIIGFGCTILVLVTCENVIFEQYSTLTLKQLLIF